MLLSDRTGRALETCYDAILDSGRWPVALQSLGESLGADRCTFATGDPVGDPLRMPRSEGHEAFAERWLRNQAHAPDPHSAPLIPRRRPGCCYVLEEDVSNEETRRKLAYYQETARPADREWWAAVRFTVEGRNWCLSLYRGASKGPFTIEDTRTFSAVVPHLSRITALSEKFADETMSFGIKFIDELHVAVIVLDAAGKALRMSSGAEALLGPDFYLVHGRPAVRHSGSDARLRSMLSAALASRTPTENKSEPTVVLRNGVPWLLAEAMNMTRFGRDVFSKGEIALVLTDLASPSKPPETVWGVVFGLTPAEARLADRIVQGSGIDGAARSLHIGRETARSQLKSVFFKTRTRSQVELAALASRIGR